MKISELMKKKGITKYRLAKDSGVPYSTLSDICSGKTDITKCSAWTFYHLARSLEVSMEELIEPYVDRRPSFELFKSEICHRLKTLGDLDFVIETLSQKEIELYIDKEWYPEGLYLLGMVDYVSRINNVPPCDRYNDVRRMKLKETLYPSSVLAMSLAMNDNNILEEATKDAIPEFLRFNIVEKEIRDAC